jgi:hypothetical protein
MSYTIECHTLFDINHTGVINRQNPSMDIDPVVWLYRRNTQWNFDTVLQAISLRSQPEVTAYPTKYQVKLDKVDYFGFLFTPPEHKIYSWTFTFAVQHPSVFDNGIHELGHLYSDCHSVPIIKCNTEWDKLPAFLDTSDELRNIYFKVIND